MTETSMDFLPPDRRIFRPFDSLGEALRAAAKAAWPFNTANHAQRRWGLEASTAENLAKGSSGGRTVIKAVRAEGKNAWALWDALGELVIGEPREAFEERRLQQLEEEVALARSRLEARTARRRQLEADAASSRGLGAG